MKKKEYDGKERFEKKEDAMCDEMLDEVKEDSTNRKQKGRETKQI